MPTELKSVVKIKALEKCEFERATPHTMGSKRKEWTSWTALHSEAGMKNAPRKMVTTLSMMIRR